MDLKMTAARERKSVAEVVRRRLSAKTKVEEKKDLVERLEKFAKQMAKQNPGVSFSRELIKMRYEQ